MNDGRFIKLIDYKSLATTSIYINLVHDFNKLTNIKYDKKTNTQFKTYSLFS